MNHGLAARALAPCALLLLAACSSAPPAAAPAAAAPSTPEAAPMPRIGIALGGGAAKGFAHIGVLKVLEAHALAPAAIAGTSAGSVVGALYASGLDAAALQARARELDEANLSDLQWSASGLVRGKKLEDYVNQQVGNKPLEQLARPFVAVATRLEDGHRTAFARGNTGQAVRASASVPGVFQPVVIAGYHYVDGGVVSPVPVDAVRALGVDVVVAVDISSKASGKAPTHLLDALGQSIDIMGQKLGQAERARADVLIHPQVLDIGAADFSQRSQAIALGEQAASAALPQLRTRIAQWQQQWRDAQRATRERTQQLAQEQAAKARESCLAQRSRLQKLATLAGMQDDCGAPASASAPTSP